MKILITNDDGIGAVGISALVAWAKRHGDVTVVAPKVEQSGKSHAIDFVNKIEIKKLDMWDGVNAYAMDSTPADCVRFGIVGLGEKYDLVLSGINRGVNVGGDIVYSGTVGAIFEAARLGHRAMAVSAFPNGERAAAEHLDDVYSFINGQGLFDENLIYNVNIPADVNDIRVTRQGSFYFSDEFVHCGGDLYMQVGDILPDECPDDINRDTVAVHRGIISVTPVLATRTNMQVFEKFKR